MWVMATFGFFTLVPERGDKDLTLISKTTNEIARKRNTAVLGAAHKAHAELLR